MTSNTNQQLDTSSNLVDHQHKLDLNGVQDTNTGLLSNIQNIGGVGKMQHYILLAKESKIFLGIKKYANAILIFGILLFAGLSVVSYRYFSASIFYSALFRSSEDVNHLLLIIPIVISCIGLYGTLFHNSSSKILKLVSIN